jgi:hypothetical protein
VQEGWSPWHDPGAFPDEFRGEGAVCLVGGWRVEGGLCDGGGTVVAALLGLHRVTLRRCWINGPMATHGRVLAWCGLRTSAVIASVVVGVSLMARRGRSAQPINEAAWSGTKRWVSRGGR